MNGLGVKLLAVKSQQMSLDKTMGTVGLAAGTILYGAFNWNHIVSLKLASIASFLKFCNNSFFFATGIEVNFS